VPPRKSNPTPPAKTNLAKARLKAGITQKDMASWVGVSLRHYRRMETSNEEELRENPTLAFLVNCSLALHVPFDDVAPPRWRKTWRRFSRDTPARPPTKRELEKARRRWEV
jgi:transcriptional regulator with XRE-family HTH domain